MTFPEPVPSSLPPPKKARRLLPYVIVGVLVGVPLLAVALVAALSGPSIPSKAVLRMNLTGEVPERVESDGLLSLLSKPQLTVKDHLDNLKKAAADKRIRGVLLKLDGAQLGWAKVEELRDALRAFRKSGKFVIAYAEQLSAPDYALAISADEVLMPSDSSFAVTGLSAEVLHLPGLLEKLGIEVQYFRYGKYKSVSGETFGRKALTEPVKEMINENLDGQYRRLVEMIALDRKLPPDQVRALIDAPGLRANWAQEHKLVDGLAYFDQVEANLRGKLGVEEKEDVPYVSAASYQKVSLSDAGVKEGKDVVALIYSVGLIVAGEGGTDPLGGGPSQGTRPIIEALRRAAKDSDVKAVVFRVDSPGGAGLGCDLVRREIEALVKTKPVVVSMSDAAASGGYWVSMNASAIVAQPSTVTGSIGIWAVVPNLKTTYALLGVNPETFTRGAHADMFSGARPFTAEEAKLFDDELLASYRRFVELAAKGRNKTVEQMEEVAQGHTWSGERAKELGLVDALGGLDTAVDLARQKAGLGEKRVRVEVFEKKKTLLGQLLGRDDEEDEPALAPAARAAFLATGIPAALDRLGAPLWTSELLSGREHLFLTPECSMRMR